MAKIEYSDEDNCFVGRIVGVKDIVGFHADTRSKLRSSTSSRNDGLKNCFALASNDGLKGCFALASNVGDH